MLKTKKPFSRKTCKNETTAPVRAAFLNQWLVQLLIIEMCVFHVVLIQNVTVKNHSIQNTLL